MLGHTTMETGRHEQRRVHVLLSAALGALLPRQQWLRHSLQRSLYSPEGLLSPPKKVVVSEQRLHPLMIVLGG